MISEIFQRRFQNGADIQSQSQTIEAVDLIAIQISVDVAISGTLTVPVTLDVSKLQGVYISTSVDDGCSFNPDGTTPTFTIYNGSPGVYTIDNPNTNFLTDDLTNFLITNLSSTAMAFVEMRFLSTP